MGGMAHPPHDPAVTRDGQPRRRSPRAIRPAPVTPAMLEGAPDFAPAPREATRYDGWTPDRQRLFVKALAETGCVTRACAAVGMSTVGAYPLRRGKGAQAFAKAWDAAIAVGVARLADIAYERAVYGIPVPVFHKGEQVGETRRYNDRLLMWVMRHADRERYDDVPHGNHVPPHIRKALRAEWEREKAEEEAERRRQTGSSVEKLYETLRQMRSRMNAPPGPRDSLASVAAWAMYDENGEVRTLPPEEPAPPPPAAPPGDPHADADADAAWAAHRQRQDLLARAGVCATGDPLDAEANAAAHWQAMMEAGLIGGDPRPQEDAPSGDARHRPDDAIGPAA
jgi:hypothetical protein